MADTMEKSLSEFYSNSSTVKMDVDIATVHACNVCDSETNLKRCARCKKVAYCSRNCQKKDWKTHQEKCSGASSSSSQRPGPAPASSNGLNENANRNIETFYRSDRLAVGLCYFCLF